MKKNAFILSQPFDIPAKAVVREAIGAGIKIKAGYVHIVRSAARKKGLTTVRLRGQKTDARAETPESTVQLRRKLRVLVMRLGCDVSQEVVDEVREVNIS